VNRRLYASRQAFKQIIDTMNWRILDLGPYRCNPSEARLSAPRFSQRGPDKKIGTSRYRSYCYYRLSRGIWKSYWIGLSNPHHVVLKKRNKTTFLPSSHRMHWRKHQNARGNNKYLTATIKILLSACTIIFKDLYLFWVGYQARLVFDSLLT